MLLIFIVSIVASWAFRRETIRKGYGSTRATLYPLILGTAVWSLGFIMGLVMGFLFAKVGTGETVIRVFGWIANLLLLLMFFIALARSWQTLKQLPDQSNKSGLPRA